MMHRTRRAEKWNAGRMSATAGAVLAAIALGTVGGCGKDVESGGAPPAGAGGNTNGVATSDGASDPLAIYYYEQRLADTLASFKAFEAAARRASEAVKPPAGGSLLSKYREMMAQELEKESIPSTFERPWNESTYLGMFSQPADQLNHAAIERALIMLRHPSGFDEHVFPWGGTPPESRPENDLFFRQDLEQRVFALIVSVELEQVTEASVILAGALSSAADALNNDSRVPDDAEPLDPLFGGEGGGGSSLRVFAVDLTVLPIKGVRPSADDMSEFSVIGFGTVGSAVGPRLKLPVKDFEALSSVEKVLPVKSGETSSITHVAYERVSSDRFRVAIKLRDGGIVTLISDHNGDNSGLEGPHHEQDAAIRAYEELLPKGSWQTESD